MTPHRLTDTEFHAASSHSKVHRVGYRNGCTRSEHAIIHEETCEAKGNSSHRRYSGSRPRSSTRRRVYSATAFPTGEILPAFSQTFEVLTPAPCARRT